MTLKTKLLEKRVKYLEKDWKYQKFLINRLKNIKKERAVTNKRKKKKISTSKLLIIFLFVNCSLLELFSCWATIKMLDIALINGTMIDFTPLVALIGSVVAETLGYAVYSLKAAKENTIGGVVHDLAVREMEGTVG